jgi:phage repressor protein C with HTH and peptisase S24 domain
MRLQDFLQTQKNSFMKLPFFRFRVSGNSMAPSYKNGDKVVLFNWGRISKGDVVIFRKENIDMMKRVVDKSSAGFEMRGDNAAESTDSGEFGPVEKTKVVGRVLFKY